jgi:NAD(P)-dependent dehydrogenase (short-subunit alcohol dehydrogenase family)
MDPSLFPVSDPPLNHAPYGPILPHALKGTLRGKVAVVTGAARGIGRAISLALANSGATLAILDINPDGLAETAEIVEKTHNTEVTTWPCDVRSEADVARNVSDIVGSLGGIDILVNNAGKFLARPQSMIANFATYWDCIEVNFKATMLFTWYVLPYMRQRKSGTIVNIASRAATVDTPLGMGYNDAKAAVVRAIGTLQLDLDLERLGDSITCYALHPGGVATDMGAKAHSQDDVMKRFPQMFEAQDEGFKKLFKDPPELCGQTVAWLATGAGKELKGTYHDCRQDVERVLRLRKKGVEGDGVLQMKFLEGYGNEP